MVENTYDPIDPKCVTWASRKVGYNESFAVVEVKLRKYIGIVFVRDFFADLRIKRVLLTTKFASADTETHNTNFETVLNEIERIQTVPLVQLYYEMKERGF